MEAQKQIGDRSLRNIDFSYCEKPSRIDGLRSIKSVFPSAYYPIVNLSQHE
jgi:hypothetical protein